MQNFGLRAKDFKQACQNCILRVQMNAFGFKKFFKREHVDTGLANHGLKKLHTVRMVFLS